MNFDELQPDIIVKGAIFPEPVCVITTTLLGDSVKLIGKGIPSGQVHEAILNKEQLATLQAGPLKEPFDGDPQKFRLGIEAMRLALAYEYDPFFVLSIARVDPLPHQLEAVYDYFLKLPRIRFLLADDPGAGKTIMAGLLIKELKIRGLIQRILIITPANLSFQWQREMKDKFRESFEWIRGDVLRAHYGANPWQERNQVITSIAWVSRIEDAKESLMHSHWDLIIVDEAHKMSASQHQKTLAYQLGERLSEMTDHYLLMTATPHKGDPEKFRRFLALLDQDVYRDIKSLQEAMKQQEAPFYLRRIKEALVNFPDVETGEVKTLFTQRNVKTREFQIDAEEFEFYEALTAYVETQSIKAAADDSARGRALGFTMALLQRRFSSSLYAVRRSLERMTEKREKILADPQAYRAEQIAKKLPDDFDELPEAEQQTLLDDLEGVVASVDSAALQQEITELGALIQQAQRLENREVETKLRQLKEVLTEHRIFDDPQMKLLVFTEHKDTLNYLVGKLKDWGVRVTQIHGGMKIGDRNTAGTRIYAEQEFRQDCQILVATEAAGEGINLQFCWFMLNYDIPWNPVRLEQRMGRIHRYGQEKDCLIINFVSTNTREGRVLQKLFERIAQIERDLDPRRTGKVFNVIGDAFPPNTLERMLRDMYAHNQMTEDLIKSRIVEAFDSERFRQITDSTLEGLAKKEINLSAIVEKSAESKERRLVPEVIEDFFWQAAPLVGISLKEQGREKKIYRIGKIPHSLSMVSESFESRFGKLGRAYKQIVFDKQFLQTDPTLEWVTPGHPLFERVREKVLEHVTNDLQRGAVFYDLHQKAPYRLDTYSAAIRDGRGNTLYQRLFVVQTGLDGSLSMRQPTIFQDLTLRDAKASPTINLPHEEGLPDKNQLARTLIEKALTPLLAKIRQQRETEIERISRHVETSLNALIHRQNLKMAELVEQQQSGTVDPLLRANLKTTENRLEELNSRLDQRRAELQQERQCTIVDIQHQGRAWVLPHPERTAPQVAAMVRDEQIERIAIAAATAYEEARGWRVESVEQDNRGFDLISRKPHPDQPQSALQVRFIEVKGRAATGEVALTPNEYKTAQRLTQDYWLYVVYHCATTPAVHVIPNPAQMVWQPLVKIEHYHIGTEEVLAAAKK